MTAKALRTEVLSGMVVEWDVPIAMDDGLVLHGDVYRQQAEAAIRSC